MLESLGLSPPPWAVVVLKLAASAVAGLVAHAVLGSILRRMAKRARSELASKVVDEMGPATRLLFVLFAIQLVVPAIDGLPEATLAAIRHGLVLVTIAAVAWLAIGLTKCMAEIIRAHYQLGVADNFRARAVHTRIGVLHRTLEMIIIVVAIAMALMSFPSVRQIGTTLLASAGIAGLAIGLAARPVLENLIAGIQLALTQPIRIDDIVIFEGEWGRIEQITMTYVVVRIWDDRRLIVPISKFIDQPFESWTRRTAELLGTVFLYADYTVPVDRVRAALSEIVQSEPAWDGRVCALQVTDLTDRTVQLRALVSASDSGKAWDLRVAVREKLLAFMQRELPECLPRVRVETQAVAERQSPADEHSV